ncbi:GNAT family N-acetyltransferase [Polymorphospora rubra]|uniref:GNAT family N-acetyltransferase n=1 Tax=Polymorphospora rubra TaxID=338584 RepID=UPI0033C840DD
MPVRSVHDRTELADLLARHPALYAYQLGDLDDFFWPYTTWYRLADAVALVYHGGTVPTLLALHPADGTDQLADLLRELAPLLPAHFEAHLPPGAETALRARFTGHDHGPHLKMALTDPALLATARPAGDVLTRADLPELTKLYATAYPDNWFDPRMLDTGHYVGLRRDGELVAVAGVHVWSPVYRVAALGNVTTHPTARGAGLATAAVAALCHRLRASVDHVTLNVRTDNAAARAVYARLGFTVVARYAEHTFTARRT